MGVVLLMVFSCIASAGEGIEAITKPSQDRTLSFVRAGQISHVLVKPQDPVTVGQVLVKQDDVAEQVQLSQLEEQAANTIQVRAAEAKLAQKTDDYKLMQQLSTTGDATQHELEQARLEQVIAELSLELVKFQASQDQLKLKEARLQVQRMSLISPIVGRVEDVMVEEGESVDAMKDVIRVVSIDPLWIEVAVPGEQGSGLVESQKAAQRAGKPWAQKARVVFPDETKEGGRPAETVDGSIIFVAAVKDAASNTLKVRVEVPNASGRLAGEHVQVSFPAPPQAAGGGQP